MAPEGTSRASFVSIHSAANARQLDNIWIAFRHKFRFVTALTAGKVYSGGSAEAAEVVRRQNLIAGRANRGTCAGAAEDRSIT